jgi:hypothetical protein
VVPVRKNTNENEEGSTGKKARIDPACKRLTAGPVVLY